MQTPRRLPPPELRRVLECEDACLAAFYHWRWPCGFVCPRCGAREGRRIANRPAWRCVGCNHHARVTAGTALHRSRLPLSTWLRAVILVGDRKQSVSALQLQIDLGFGCYRTAFKMLHIIRDVMEDTFALCRGAIEVGQRTIGARDIRSPAPDPDAEEGAEPATLLGIAIERHERVDEDSPLPAFGRIKLGTFLPSTHWIRVHRALVPGVPSAVAIAPITRIVSQNFLDWIRGTFHGISSRYLAAYVREFEFRFNHRRHTSIIPCILGKRLMRPTTRRRRDLTNPRALIPPMPRVVLPRAAEPAEPDEADEGDDSGDRDDGDLE